MKQRKRWEYAYYKGDELLAIGTAQEICDKLNISIKTFHWYRTKTYQKEFKWNEKCRRIITRTDEGTLQYY